LKYPFQPVLAVVYASSPMYSGAGSYENRSDVT
jgi:hypothetical protein